MPLPRGVSLFTCIGPQFNLLIPVTIKYILYVHLGFFSGSEYVPHCWGSSPDAAMPEVSDWLDKKRVIGLIRL
jgi:hypothetical protein